MTGSRWGVLMIAAVVVVVGTLALPAARRDRDRASDVDRIRSLIDQHPSYPGLEVMGESVVEQREDGVANGEFSLAITYRLPEGVGAAEVLGFHRDHLPPGWSEATDATCRIPQPDTLPSNDFEGDLVLLEQERALTAFAPPGSNNEGEGLTFRVRWVGEQHQLEVSSASYACGVSEH